MKIYSKILLWFFLNLVILGVAFYVVFRLQFRLGLDSLLMSQAGERLQSVSDLIASELITAPELKWNETLKRFSSAYKVEFVLFRGDGTQAAGEPVVLPDDVAAKVTERRGFGMGRGPPPGRGRNRPEFSAAEAHPKFMLHTERPTRYWAGSCLNMPEGELRAARLTLLAISNTFHGGGFFLDLTPWALAGFAAVIFSVLFWFPLIRSLTHSISQITSATEHIAEGRFDARVQSPRRDELGRLGQAINRMAERLAGFVTGQKRFLGDIAHELCSPIARIQMALGILEQNTDPKQKAYVEDVREDVQHMSSLVNELLAFSKASLRQKEIKLEPVNLAGLARRVIDREAADKRVEICMDESLCALAEPELLSRAMANLLRNAFRYAGDAGPIVISAETKDIMVTLTVADSGPGVPPETLEQIFDPFFRLDASRSRDTGGIGLGLSIVKTCVEACQGTVVARNRQPTGLQVEITLKAMEPAKIQL